MEFFKFFEKERIILNTPHSKEKLSKIKTIIFDMDGVITSEKNYWISAGLTALEIFYSKSYSAFNDNSSLSDQSLDKTIEQSKKFVTYNFISALKGRSINTNWDLAYFSTALFLIEAIKQVKDSNIIKEIQENGLTTRVLQLIGREVRLKVFFEYRIDDLAEKFFNKYPDINGFEYIDCLNRELHEKSEIKTSLFSRNNSFWILCFELFQEWFLGTELFKNHYNKTLSHLKKQGMVNLESPIIPLSQIDDMLSKLHESDYVLGIATGRPYDEIIRPLENWNLLKYFRKNMIATHNDVEKGEHYLSTHNTHLSLAKPHPFLFLKSLYPDENTISLMKKNYPINNKDEILVVTDSVSDIMIAKKLGCLCAVVLTGVVSEKLKKSLFNSKPEFIINDVSLLSELVFQFI